MRKSLVKSTRKKPMAEMRAAAVVLVIFGAVGCGTEERLRGTSGKKNSANVAAKESASIAPSDTKTGLTVDADADLPACDATHAGALVFVLATNTFMTCKWTAGGADVGGWTPIDLRGAAGAKGDPGAQGKDGATGKDGADAEAQNALSAYKSSRASVFRVTLACKLIANPPASCSGKAPTIGSLGTGFLCGDGVMCTNGHVVACERADPCYTLSTLSVQAVIGATDSTSSGGGAAAPFFSTAQKTAIKFHPTRDLAKVTVTGVPGGAKPVVLSTDTYDKTVTALLPVLSLSFPLGFEDLYSDMGRVDMPNLAECDTAGGISGYGCPRDLYDFSTTNDTDHGSSGSPLFDLSTGKVIGVTSAGTEKENANYTWAIDASLFGAF